MEYLLDTDCRAVLEQTGTPIGPYGLMTAGLALSRGMTLVSNNPREFARIDGLDVENWIMPGVGGA